MLRGYSQKLLSQVWMWTAGHTQHLRAESPVFLAAQLEWTHVSAFQWVSRSIFHDWTLGNWVVCLVHVMLAGSCTPDSPCARSLPLTFNLGPSHLANPQFDPL